MRQLIVFNQMTLDGYIADAKGDMSWAHKDDPEWNEFVANNAKSGGTLLFGRKTYEMMASYWPTPMAMEQNPEVARQMGELEKIVFTRSLQKATWSNTRLISGDLISSVGSLKQEPGSPMVILGSASIVAQLASENLIDEYQIVLNPVALGNGKTMFEGIERRLALRRTNVRSFGNGNVLIGYERIS